MDVETLTKQLNGEKEINRKLQNKYNDLKKNLENSKLSYGNLQMNLKDMTIESYRQTQEIFEKDRIIRDYQDEIELHLERIRFLEKANQEDQYSIMSQEETINEWVQRIESKDNEIQTLQKHYQKNKRKVTSLDKTINDLQQQILSNKHEVQRLEKTNQEEKYKIMSQEKTINELLQLIESNKTEIQRLEEINQKNQCTITSQEESINDSRQLIEFNENEFQNSEKLIKSLEIENNELLQKVSSLKEQLIQKDDFLEKEAIKLESIHTQLKQSYDKKLKEEKIKFQNEIDDLYKYKSLHDDLQEKYSIECNKNNQNQLIIQQLEDKIKSINQKHDEEIISQEELNVKYDNLRNQLQDLDQQNFLLKNENEVAQSIIGITTNFSINEQNNNDKLSDDILELQFRLRNYITDLKTKVEINFNEIRKLLIKYGCKIKISNNAPNRPFIIAVLQRYILEEIINESNNYFDHTGEEQYYLESEIVSNTTILTNLIKDFQNDRIDDEITRLTMTRLRQQVYSLLNTRGFSNSENSKHRLIEDISLKINMTMNKYRKIKDDEMKEYVDSLAENLVRNVIKIFYFRLSIQEPIAQHRWFLNNEIINKSYAKDYLVDDDDSEDVTVEVCSFPLIYTSNANVLKIISPARVFSSPAE